jgi:hypothetical protein
VRFINSVTETPSGPMFRCEMFIELVS